MLMVFYSQIKFLVQVVGYKSVRKYKSKCITNNGLGSLHSG